jgi:rhombotail lipoprotein
MYFHEPFRADVFIEPGELLVSDPLTRSPVLRAGGTDTHHQNSTLVDMRRNTRLANAESFDAATQQMILHFDGALTAFARDVHEGRANVHVAARSASGGGVRGGAVGAAARS